jgi:bilirubin oxidase
MNLRLLFLLLAIGGYGLAQPNFYNAISAPPIVDAADGPINLSVDTTLHQFDPGNPTNYLLNGKPSQGGGIRTWAYNIEGGNANTFLGPTVIWNTGENIEINVRNAVSQATTVHWHGAEVPAMMDGGPHEPFLPGDTLHVSFQDRDSASTMWYHPHVHNNTYPQVQMGLSGLLLSKQAVDPIGATLPSDYGVDDFPIILGDLGLDSVLVGGEYHYVIDTIAPPNAGHRPYNVVNGVTNPYVELPASMVRLRILNGSTRKGVQYGVSDGYNDPLASLIPFYLVATDGGYVMNPMQHKTMLMGPGVRNEIVLDLTNKLPGDVLYLRNLKELMTGDIVGSPQPSAGPGGGQDSTSGNAFLQIRIVPDPPGFIPVITPPSFTNNWTPDIADSTNGITGLRTKRLTKTPNVGFTIDDQTYDMMRIDDIVCEGAKEIWTIKNETTVSHPFHIHKIFFRILTIDSLDATSGAVVAQIDPAARGFNGPKDNVLVRPNWKLRFLGKFDDYATDINYMKTYMYHCHILTHEDEIGGGMMHQFVVTNEGPCVVGLETQQALQFELYPNPASSELFVEAPGGGELTLFDMRGNAILATTLAESNGSQHINLDGLSRGMYVVQLAQDGRLSTKKLVLD